MNGDAGAEMLDALLLILTIQAGPTPAQFTSFEGAFSVAFPGVPRERTFVAAPDDERYTYSLSADHVAYWVTVVCLSPAGRSADPQKVLDEARDSALRVTGGRLVSEKRLRVGGRPAADTTERVPPGGSVVYGRLVVGEAAFYSLAATAEGSGDAPAALKFLESFRPLKPTARSKCAP